MIRYIQQVIGTSEEISASIVRDGVDWHNIQVEKTGAFGNLRGEALAGFHACEGLGGGFGIGVDMEAEGWVNDAVGFWAKYIVFYRE